MNSAEKFGVYGVQARARRSESAWIRPGNVQDWEGDDAVPLRPPNRRTRPAGRSGPTGNSDTVQARRTAEGGAQGSYRVRDAAYRAQAKAYAKRASAAAAAADSPGHAERTDRRRERTIPTDRRRARPDPDAAHNTDAIFREEEQSESRRLASRVRALYQAKRTTLIGILVAVLVAFLALLVYNGFFVVSGIEVEGAQRYTSDEITAASGVTEGDNLFSFSSRVVMEEVTLRLPYIQSLTVDRTIPDQVLFTVAEEEAVFWAEIYGEVRALSGTLRVLEQTDRADAEERGLIRLQLSEVESAVSGRVLELRDERSMTRIREVLSAVLASDLRTRITSIDLRNLWQLHMVSDDCYLLDFGSAEDVAVKLRVACAVLSDSLFDATVKAEIDLTVTGSTSVIFDDQLSFGS